MPLDNMNNNLLKIKRWIKYKEVKEVRNFVNDSSIFMINELLAELDDIEIVLFFRFLKSDDASELFAKTTDVIQQTLISNFSKEEVAEIINELYANEVADLLEILPPDIAKSILSSVNNETRNKINKILEYDDEHIGSLMSVDIIPLNENLTNKEALNFIKSKRNDNELSHFYFIINNKNDLIGAVSFEDLVFSNSRELITKKMFKTPFLNTRQNKEEAANIFSNEDMSTLPVLDSNDKLIGMLNFDDVIDILRDEATEELYKASGISTKSNMNSSYLKTNIIQLVKSRIFWLIILMIGSTFSQVLIQFMSNSFENHYGDLLGTATSTILLAMIPVTTSTSGNAGSQSTASLTRAAALGEIKKGKYAKVIWKEFNVGLILGILLAIINYARLCLYYTATQEIFNNTKEILLISFASSLSLFFSIFLAKVLGASILVLGLKTKKDPTVMASPVLTTVIDVISTAIFFGSTFAILSMFLI